MGHIPVSRRFQRVAVDLVEYTPGHRKDASWFFQALMYLTRYVILEALPNKEAATIAQVVVDRVFSDFGVPELLHSDQGGEFENELVRQLQRMFGYKKTQTIPYYPQGNPVLERFHSTMHSMLEMYCDIAQDNWADMLPFVQMAHNMAYHSTVLEAPHYLMFGRPAVLPTGIIMGLPKAETVAENAAKYTTQAVENMQFAYELACQNLEEKAQAKETANATLKFTQFNPGDLVLVHCPREASDDPNPKLVSPWCGPFIIRSRRSPVVYRVSKQSQVKEISVHLARLKPFRAQNPSPSPDMDGKAEMFVGERIPVPDIDNERLIFVGPYVWIGCQNP